MLLQPYNELRFNVRIEATSPLLVKESRFEDAFRDEMSKEQAVRAPNVIPISRADRAAIKNAVTPRQTQDGYTNPLDACARLNFFLPASSLRGVARSHLERLLRSGDPPGAETVCDPFDDEPDSDICSCSAALTRRRDVIGEMGGDHKPALHLYLHSCPICRLFGSTLLASRIVFTDGEPVPNNVRLVQRDHVRIDRRKGSVTSPPGPLKFYALLPAQFEFSMRLQNFELSQVVLVWALLAAIEREDITIGSGRSKGYGRVKLASCQVALTYFGREQPPNVLCGVAEHTDPKRRAWFRQRYGITGRDAGIPLAPETWSRPDPWRHERAIAYPEFTRICKDLPLPNAGPLAGRRLEATA